jgi:hypothetical protein
MSKRPVESPEGRTRRTIKRPSSSTEAFFRTDGPHADPLLVVYHIQKTAGTSLRRVVRANLPESEVELGADLRSIWYDPAALRRWYEDWYRSLDEGRRRRLCCVMSHAAGYLLPALDRPAETVVLIREPVDRVVSFYYFKQHLDGPAGYRPAEAFPPLADIYAMDDEDRARARLPKGLESWDQFYNWQSRALLSVFHDVSALAYTKGPPADAELWRERLRELVENAFHVGVQDRFAEFVELLGRRFGWTPFVPRAKVNKRRPVDVATSDSFRETISAYNWLDVELHELSQALQERRASATP